jgi:DNA (cytosine-5)-methyltransferase 1
MRVLDLFAGCGGMSLGFRQAGAEIVAGLEIEAARAKTHALNFHRDRGDEVFARHARPCDITSKPPRETVNEIAGPDSEVDVIVGGPPCQAYARVGRAKLREIRQHPDAYLHDPRGQLYAAYVRYVEALQPVVLIMENVPDILSYGSTNVAELAAEGLEELGYVCKYTLLNAANYGVPQTRERWYLIGIHKSLEVKPSFPEPTHWVDLPPGYRGTRSKAASLSLFGEENGSRFFTVPPASPSLPHAIGCEDALSDLPVISREEKLSLGRGARDLTARRPYRSGRPTDYQRLMRACSTKPSVSAHVIRTQVRDYEIFRNMAEGDDYPAAFAVAERLFEEEVWRREAAGESVPRGRELWKSIRTGMVPPYDPSKFANKWRKLERKRPSRTLMAHLGHDTYSHIHYDSDQARTISVREAARLQSFPDSFEFIGGMNTAFAQIGNAVPPRMANALALHLQRLLEIAR